MTEDQVVGLLVGTAVGDALGATLEFKSPEDITWKHTDMTGGGYHNTSVGEWTDDTALMMAAAESYVSRMQFDASDIANNFKSWRMTGKFGTRNYVFDIGGTTADAIACMIRDRPYAGKATFDSSGNGSIMRVAPAIAANHNNLHAAIGEGTALSLMTHGNSDTITYISAFIAEVIHGKPLDCYRRLRIWNLQNPDGAGGTIMHSYNVAMKDAVYGMQKECFEAGLVRAVNRGYDADTNGAVTGMLLGGWMGYSSIPKRWLEPLHQHGRIVELGKELYKLGVGRCPNPVI